MRTNQSEDVNKSVEFDESSDEEVGLNVVTDDTASDNLYQQVGRATNFLFGARTRYGREVRFNNRLLLV